MVKNPPANTGDLVQSLGRKVPLEKEMPHTPIVLPEDCGGLQSMGLPNSQTTMFI